MSLEDARYFAECWVDKHKERIFEIIDKDFKFRDFFLRDLLVDDNQTAYAGLPAIYLTKCAQRDPITFDILVDLLVTAQDVWMRRGSSFSGSHARRISAIN